MLTPQFPLPPLVVFQLVGELSLVLGSDQVGAGPLDSRQMPELQLLHGLMMPEQHCMFQILLRLPLVQLLKNIVKGFSNREIRKMGMSKKHLCS